MARFLAQVLARFLAQFLALFREQIGAVFGSGAVRMLFISLIETRRLPENPQHRICGISGLVARQAWAVAGDAAVA